MILHNLLVAMLHRILLMIASMSQRRMVLHLFCFTAVIAVLIVDVILNVLILLS